MIQRAVNPSLRSSPKTIFLQFQARARAALLEFDTTQTHPQVQQFQRPVKIYRETIDNKTFRMFAVLNHQQKDIQFTHLKSAIAYELGILQPTYRQVIGDSSVFGAQGTLAGEDLLDRELKPNLQHSIILYGYTGNKANNQDHKQLLDVNGLVSYWLQKNNIDPKHILANIVDLQTPMAINEWNCDISALVANFLMVYSSSEPSVKFGDDTHLSDNLSDHMICMEGGIQSVLQIMNGLQINIPIVVKKGLRDLTDSKNVEPDTNMPYLSAAGFFNYLQDKISRHRGTLNANEISNLFSGYVAEHPLFNRKRLDAGTKPALWQLATEVFEKHTLSKQLTLIKLDEPKGKLSMCSSTKILNTLDINNNLKEKPIEFAQEVLSGNIANAAVFLQRVRAVYPEFSFYSGTVEGSPDGTKISGSEQEQKRTELSFLCLFWLLRGDYDQLTKLQKPEEKLSRATFNILQTKVTTLLHEPKALDAMFATMAIHDLGKIVWYQNKVKAISKSNSNDHDEILLFALKHAPDIMPSYARLNQYYQDLILKAWELHFNLGQFVQGENLPANLTKCLQAARNNPHIINYLFLHEMLDLGGVTGHDSLEGSQLLNEANCFGCSAAWSAIVNPAYNNEVEVYHAYMSARAARLELDIQNAEQRIVVRLCCNARAFDAADGQLILEAYRSLPKACKTILSKELETTGLDNEKGILLYYAPQTIANLIKNKTGEQRKIALQHGFELLARLYIETRIHLKNKREPGIYPLFILNVANAAANDPEMLKCKQIEINFKEGKVTNITDRLPIRTNLFPSMQSLSELPGERLVIIGIGGGSDGIQAKLLSELAEQSGKQVVGTVSVRTKYTQFNSRDVPKGTARTIEAPAAVLGKDIYLLAPDSEGINFDRFLENAVADSKTTYMLLDGVQDSLTDAENITALSQQFAHLFALLKPDAVIALDTGGDGLYQKMQIIDAGASPDQDLRVKEALKDLDIPHLLSVEVATGVDSPANAEEVLTKAQACYFAPSDENKRYLLNRYQELGMDEITARADRFGKTPLAWQVAMRNNSGKGYSFLPIPEERILDPKSPWNPVVFIEPAMQGIFVMLMKNHLTAICQPIVAEPEPTAQARL